MFRRYVHAPLSPITRKGRPRNCTYHLLSTKNHVVQNQRHLALHISSSVMSVKTAILCRLSFIFAFLPTSLNTRTDFKRKRTVALTAHPLHQSFLKLSKKSGINGNLCEHSYTLNEVLQTTIVAKAIKFGVTFRMVTNEQQNSVT